MDRRLATAITTCNNILGANSRYEPGAVWQNTGTPTDPVYLPETSGFLNNDQNPEVILGFLLGTANTHFTSYMNCYGEGTLAFPEPINIDNRLFEAIASVTIKDCFVESALGNYTYLLIIQWHLFLYTNIKYAATHPLNGTDKKTGGTSTALHATSV